MRLDPAITVYYVRHGETEWNAAQRTQGHTDIPLNENGRAQARRNGVRLRTLLGDAPQLSFVASPLSRACETMEIIRDELGLASAGYRTDERIKELGFGVSEGVRWPDYVASLFAAEARDGVDPWTYAPEGGESYATGFTRASGFFESLAEDTVVVAHGGISRCVHAALGVLERRDAIAHLIPQDKVMVLRAGRLDWA